VRGVDVIFWGLVREKLENAMALITSPKKRICTRSKGGVEATDPEMLLRMAMKELRQLKEERVLQAAARGICYDVAVTGQGTSKPP